MTTTLADLLTTQTVTQLFQTLLSVYQAAGFPVQSWQPFGVERTRLMAIATGLADLSGNYIPQLAAGGFVDYSTGTSLQLLAREMYNIEFNVATFTVGNITLTAATGSGPYVYAAGSLIAVFAVSGNRYINTTAGTLNLSSADSIEFQAEFAGVDYNDPSSSGNLTLVTPLPGVTLSNPASDYSDVTQVGSGTGTLTLTVTPVGSHQITVRIDSTGAAGAVSWSYAVDGAAYVSAGIVASLANVGGTSCTITLTDGASGTSFVLDDTYSFSMPGSWITSQGSDVETDAALATRCRDRWSTLSPIPVNNFYEELAMSTPDVGSQVTQVIVLPNSYINNQISIVVAGAAGSLPGATVDAIQAYVSLRVPGTEYPLVYTPNLVYIPLTGTITVTAAQLATAQDAITTAMTNYLTGQGINPTIRLATITELIMQVSGVVDISGLTINGSATNYVFYSLTFFQTVTPTLPLGFSWVTV